MFLSDTIAAISTGMTNSGIGIIRISGSEAFDVADRIFQPGKGTKKVSEMKSHTVHYGKIVSKGTAIDEVLLTVMKAPNTYTKENIVEINCHGGVVVVNKIMEIVMENGARPAEPGEYTKRAFLKLCLYLPLLPQNIHFRYTFHMCKYNKTDIIMMATETATLARDST